MGKEKYAVLAIDDEAVIRRLLQKELTTEEREVQVAADGVEARSMARDQRYDVILMDLRLPDIKGLELLIEIKESVPIAEVIMITGHGDVDSAVEAMKLGAYDFISKPFNLDQLDLVVEKAHQRAVLSRENSILRQSSKYANPVRFIGKSEAIREIRFLIDKVAPANIPVLITGESGVGKDVVARLIHQRSNRVENPIIIKNCASLQKDLARSELFGHKKGAFTGADESSEGLLSYAHDGTLFLDEIGELPLEVQAALLRLLENQTYRRVGEKEERKVDIRFLFATNRNLQTEEDSGKFNEAFLHRINAFQIKIPKLSERKEDLPLLVDFFLNKLSPDGTEFKLVSGAMDCLLAYEWPGNIRELRNVIERSIILAENNIITERCLPRELVAETRSNPKGLSLASVEKNHIFKILDFHEGNRQKSAETLGISRKTLYRKLEKFSIE